MEQCDAEYIILSFGQYPFLEHLLNLRKSQKHLVTRQHISVGQVCRVQAHNTESAAFVNKTAITNQVTILTDTFTII